VKKSSKKIVFSVFPFFALIISLSLLQIIHTHFSLLDNEWPIRQFVLGFFIIAGIAIIPNLLHMRTYFSGSVPSFQFNLTHHSDDIRGMHEFKFNEYWVCSGCFGSFIGILIGETIFLSYFLNRSIFQGISEINILLIGILFIIISYSRYLIPFNPRTRVLQHASLFVGLALALIGSEMVFESAFSLIILLPSWLLFLSIRVQLSKLDHQVSNS
jgi:hypothetical protein